MMITNQQVRSSQDVIEVQALIEKWAKAVREENREGIRADKENGRFAIVRVARR
jgi:hypothetical protein